MASLIEEKLRGKECKDFIKTLWSNNPLIWNENLSIKEKMVFSTNVFTRMRYLKKENLSLEFETKICPDDNQSDLILPWYDFDSSIFSRYKIITGHWSTLGFKETPCCGEKVLPSILILNLFNNLFFSTSSLGLETKSISSQLASMGDCLSISFL